MSTRAPGPGPLDLATMVGVDTLLSGHGVPHLIYGGWGLDIITGRQSRPHRDLDLFCWRRDYHRLRTLLAGNGISGYELPGVHLAVKAPFRADIVFLDDPDAGWVAGRASSFKVLVPHRGLRDWAYGTVEGHRLPVGCVELVVRLCRFSPHSRPGDRVLVEEITARCDRRLLGEIARTDLPYDHNVEWRPWVTPGWPARPGPPPRSRAAGP